MIVQVRRFGGSAAWGIKCQDGVHIFSGASGTWIGNWFIENEGIDWWEVPDDRVPDKIWADLAKWRLLNGDSNEPA